MRLTEDLIDYFLAPKQSGYDVPKTLLYSFVLIIAVYLIFKILKRLKINVDKRLAIAISPYIVFGAALRVVQDIGVVDSYFFMTPGIYVFVFLMTFVSIIVSILIKRKFRVPYYKTMFTLGVMTLPLVFYHIKAVNIYGSSIVIALFLPWLFVFKVSRWSVPNKIVTLLHIFDATTTAVSMAFFGYYEQHVLPMFFIGMFGPFSFIALKLVVIVSILFIIDKSLKNDPSVDKEFIAYLKLIIGILGAATGTRDFITLLAGV